VLGAADVGARHQRDRFWLVAHSNLPEWREVSGPCDGLAESQDGVLGLWQEGAGGPGAGGEALVHPGGRRHRASSIEVRPGRHSIEHPGWWSTEPDVGRVADGVAARVDRLRALGNGQVPQCAAAAWRMLCGAQP
jgi:DNA (cytosine-5)-methyltransferase 1